MQAAEKLPSQAVKSFSTLVDAWLIAGPLMQVNASPARLLKSKDENAWRFQNESQCGVEQSLRDAWRFVEMASSRIARAGPFNC